jgi:hypothetical protein
MSLRMKLMGAEYEPSRTSQLRDGFRRRDIRGSPRNDLVRPHP